MTRSRSLTTAGALSAAVAVEHQVVYGYGVAGAQLSGRDRTRALAALDSHRARRDQLTQLLSRLGVAAPAAAAAYALPFPVQGAASARALCARLEDACAAAAWDLAAASGPRAAPRALAVGWLTDAAVTAGSWRAPAAAGPPLPGQPA